MDQELLKILSSMLDEKLKPISIRQDEIYQVVKALEHLSEINLIV